METVKQLVKRMLGMDYKSRCVREVLVAFEHMGAGPDELRYEKQKLIDDEMYLAEWSVAVNPNRKFG